jgi:alkylhydroperoxidase family enzyme
MGWWTTDHGRRSQIEARRRSEMANVTLVTNPKRLVPKLAFGYSRKKFKNVVDPVRAAANHSGVLVAMGALETAADRGWRKLDPHMRWLAIQATSGAIGCSWCTDFGYFEGVQQGVDPRKVRDVARWRSSDVYDERERVVLEYAEAATTTPSAVGEDLVGRLHEHFSDAEIVELAGWVALENFRSRFNAGMGLHSEGFSDNCRVPDDLSAQAHPA